MSSYGSDSIDLKGTYVRRSATHGYLSGITSGQDPYTVAELHDAYVHDRITIEKLEELLTEALEREESELPYTEREIEREIARITGVYEVTQGQVIPVRGNPADRDDT